MNGVKNENAFDFETISYLGNEYPGRYVYVPTFGNILISTSELNDALINSDGAYASEEASIVDQQICFFVDTNDLQLEENKLRQLLIYELDVEESN